MRWLFQTNNLQIQCYVCIYFVDNVLNTILVFLNLMNLPQTLTLSLSTLKLMTVREFFNSYPGVGCNLYLL